MHLHKFVVYFLRNGIRIEGGFHLPFFHKEERGKHNMSDQFVTYDGKTVTEEQCILEHDRMLRHIIRRNYASTYNSLIDEEDLLQELRICLIRAARNFDATRGFKFSTYAYRSCVFAVRRYFRDFGYRTRVHATTRETVPKIRKYRECLSYAEAMARRAEWAEAFDVPDQCVTEAVRIVYLGEIVSFDAIAKKRKSTDEDRTYAERLASDRAEQEYAEAAYWGQFNQAIEKLDARERYAMTAFVNGRLKKEIGEDLQVSGRTASNLISRGLSKLQRTVS